MVEMEIKLSFFSFSKIYGLNYYTLELAISLTLMKTKKSRISITWLGN